MRDFIETMGEFSLKGGGFEASAKRKQEAAAALSAAAVSHAEVGTAPEETAIDARAAAQVVSDIVTAGNESLLSTVDRDSGNAGFCVDEYWTFDKSGPCRLNFDAVNTAIRQAVPADTSFYARCSAINLDRQQIGTTAQRIGAECKACGWMGSVTVDFVLRGSIVEPTEVKYTPFAADQNN